jgi:hypothetical protein
MEIPIVVTETEINVAGFVDQIDLSVDVGPRGRRGSITFAGSTLPPTSPDSSVTDIYGMVDVFEPGDLYVRTGTGAPNYAFLYIYQQQPGGNTWSPICPLQPYLYNERRSITFTTGLSAEVQVALTDIFGTAVTSVPATDFIIQATAVMNDTNAYNFSVKTVAVDNGAGLLRFFLNGRTLAATTVANASGAITINLSIGIQN